MPFASCIRENWSRAWVQVIQDMEMFVKAKGNKKDHIGINYLSRSSSCHLQDHSTFYIGVMYLISILYYLLFVYYYKMEFVFILMPFLFHLALVTSSPHTRLTHKSAVSS